MYKRQILHLLCTWVDFLGRWCTSVYVAEQLSIVCKTNMLLLPGMGHPTVLVVIIQAGRLKQPKQWILQVSSLRNFVAFIRCNTNAHWACGVFLPPNGVVVTYSTLHDGTESGCISIQSNVLD